MAQPLRLAIIGTGLIVTRKHWPALQTLGQQFQVAALVNRSPAKTERLAATIAETTGRRPAIYSDYQTMLARERPDAVSIALPPLLNPEVTQAALEAGCHVIAEKPIAASLADAARMLPWAERYGRSVMIAENYRYFASHQRAERLIAEGAIGQPIVARWLVHAFRAIDDPYVQTAWRRQPAHPGGYLSDGGVHYAAVLRMLMGEIDTVTAQVSSVRPDMPPADTLSATLRFASGALGTWAITFAVPGPSTPLQIAGPDGALSIWRDRVELWCADKPVESWLAPSPVDGLVSMYEEFGSAIRTGQQPRSTPGAAYADLQTIVAMLRSAEQGQEVRVTAVTD